MARKIAHTPTDEQIICIDAALKLEDLRIEAYAGAAKTTTLKFISQALSPKKGLYLAFNKSVVLAADFPSNVTAKTVNSVAYAKTGKAFKHRLDTRITGRLVAEALGLSDFSGNGQLIMSASDLGAYLLTTVDRFCRDMEPVLKIDHMPIPELSSMDISAQDIRSFLWNNYQHQAWQLWEKMSSPVGTFPSRHGVYMKLWAISEPVIKGYDFIMFDEAQDADPLMLAVMAHQRVPVFYVGDRFQQIYAWRGAVNAMSKIDTTNVARLTKSFRFGNELASMADMLLCAMGADVSLRGNDAVDTELVELDRPTAILCRTNASVSKWVMDAVRDGDTDFAATGTEEALEFFASAAALKKGKPGKGKYKLFKSWGEICAYSLTDDGGDLASYIHLEREYGADFAANALKKIAGNSMDTARRVISTGHRAKGMEWDSVLLDDDFRSPLDARYQEEDSRLLYVAMTRAIHALDMTRVDTAYVDLLTHGATPQREPKVESRETTRSVMEILAMPAVDFTLTAPVFKPTKRKLPAAGTRATYKRSGTWTRRRSHKAVKSTVRF